MKYLRYRGFGRREVSGDNFSTVGVKSKDVAANSGEIVEMSDSAAAWFLENEAESWEEVSEKEAASAQAEESASTEGT